MNKLFWVTTAMAVALTYQHAHGATYQTGPTIEVHDAWGMTCRPVDGPPFQVVASRSMRMLAIKGGWGPVRSNVVQNIRSDGTGFTVFAQGRDAHGYPRSIQAHFSYDGGFLDVVDRNQPAIACDPDVPVSND